MTDRIQTTIRRASLIALAAGSAAAAAGWGPRAALGVAAGGAWNLASLWCLARLLKAWMGQHPSRRRVLGWLLVKFPLLYAAILAVFQTRLVPALAFGAGFTLVLLIAVALLAPSARRALASARPS